MGYKWVPDELIDSGNLNTGPAGFTTAERDAKNWNTDDVIANKTVGNLQYYLGADGTSVPGSWVNVTGAGSIVGTDVTLNTGGFNKLLSGADVNSQLALDTLDDHTHPSSDITGLTDNDIATSGFSGNLNGLTDQEAVNDWVDNNAGSSVGGLIDSFEKTGSANNIETLSSFTALTAIKFSVKMTTTSSGGGGVWMRINGQAGAAYSSENIYNSGGAVTLTSDTAQSLMNIVRWGSVGVREVVITGEVSCNGSGTDQLAVTTSYGGGLNIVGTGGGRGASGVPAP